MFVGDLALKRQNATFILRNLYYKVAFLDSHNNSVNDSILHTQTWA